MKPYRIILVFPPIDPPAAESLPPIGLLKIAALLDKAGYAVSVLDCIILLRKGVLHRNKKIYEEIARLINNSKPDLVGFNTQCASYPSCINIARHVKSIRKDTKIVFGGPFSSLCAVETLKRFTEIDFIVLGEAEITLLELVRTLDEQRDIQTVNGIVFKEAGQIIRTKARALIQNLDELPFPAYQLLDLGGNSSNPLAEYQNINSVVVDRAFPKKTLIDDGRGCEHRCSYCTEPLIWGHKPRRRTSSNIVKEIIELKSKFGAEFVEFTHDHFSSRKSGVKEFCQTLLDQKIDIKWGCRARLDMVDTKLLEKMKAAGCSEIIYGVESFSTEMLKSMKKDMRNIELMLSTIQQTVALEIHAHLSFMVGFPWEQPGQVDDTLDKMLEIVKNSGGWAVPYIQLLSVQPGTELWERYHDRLELNRIPGFCQGTDFDDRKFLSEDIQLIKSDLQIFAPFYNIKTENVPLDTLYVISTCFKPLAMRNPRGFRSLLELSDSSLMEFFEAMKQWLGKEIEDLDKLSRLPKNDLYELIDRYSRSFCASQFFKSLTSDDSNRSR